MLSYAEANALNGVLSGLITKPLTSTSYVKLLQFRRAVKKVSEDYSDMQTGIVTDFKIEPDGNGNIQFKPEESEKLKNFNAAINGLLKSEVEFSHDKFISMVEFEGLRQANEMNLAQEELLINWLVIE